MVNEGKFSEQKSKIKIKIIGVFIMTKYILVAVIILALVALVGCVSGTAVVGERKIYEI